MKFKRIAAVVASVAGLCSGVAAQPVDRTGPAPAIAAPHPLQPAPSAGKTPPVPPQGADVHPLEAQDLESWLDGVVPYALKTGDIAGAVILVVKDGKVLLQKGYGYADVAKKIPMDPVRTMVRPGSTSKLFTWTAVMQLVEQGKLDLDHDINGYLDFKIPQKFGKPITLRDLMNHRAGFEEGLKSILATDPRMVESTEGYLKTHQRPMLFPPGQVPAYSNYGAALAGYIVQRVSGEPFDDYVERHIFQPLGMQHSTFRQPLPGRFRGAVSQGYRTASSPPSPYEYVITRPAGSATMTAADMSRFMIAHLQQGRFGDYQMLSPQTERLMQAPSETGLPGFATMAHGFFHETRNGRTIIGHGGDTQLFHTEMDLLPEQGVGIFYTFNSRGAQDAVYQAREVLFDQFMNRYFPAPSRPVDPTALPSAKQDAQEIAGGYQSSRRVEHGFISFFYLIQQSAIVPNGDGMITGPSPTRRGMTKFREVGAQLWREVGGTRELALTRVNGVKTVVDSEDPITVLQATPFVHSSSLNMTVLMGSVLILFWTLLLWPLSPILRRGDAAQIGVSAPVRRLRALARGAAAVDLAYLVGWYMILGPVLSQHLEVYNPQLDPYVRLLQFAGLLTIAAAALGFWVVWRLFKEPAPWLSRIWSIAVAASLLGVVWIAWMAKFLSFSLNY